MIDVFANIFSACIVALWLITALLGGKLYRSFLAKHPQEANKLIPDAFTNYRHPEKFFFLFRKASLPLFRADRNLWKQRQRLKVLMFISILTPALFIAFGAILAFININK